MLKLLIKIVMTALFALAAPANAGVQAGKILPMSAPPKGAEVVTVGFYPMNIYNVDPASSTFVFDGYIWFRWKGDIDPTKTVEFTNAVNKSSISKELLYEAPQTGKDGTKYQIMRIESAFLQPFSLAQFPLDKHALSITVEDSLNGKDQLVYVIDQADTSYAPGLTISGWKLNNWSHQKTIVDYASTFGDIGASQASQYARLTFNVNIARPESYFIWKLLLPLVVVLCGAWIALLLSPALTETRAALPASALLTTVFLQQGYTASLPETGGLVLLDEIYVVAYILIVLTLAHVIIKSRNIDEKTEAEIQVMRAKDMRSLVVQVIIFIAASTLLVALR